MAGVLLAASFLRTKCARCAVVEVDVDLSRRRERWQPGAGGTPTAGRPFSVSSAKLRANNGDPHAFSVTRTTRVSCVVLCRPGLPHQLVPDARRPGHLRTTLNGESIARGGGSAEARSGAGWGVCPRPWLVLELPDKPSTRWSLTRRSTSPSLCLRQHLELHPVDVLSDRALLPGTPEHDYRVRQRERGCNKRKPCLYRQRV